MCIGRFTSEPAGAVVEKLREQFCIVNTRVGASSTRFRMSTTLSGPLRRNPATDATRLRTIFGADPTQPILTGIANGRCAPLDFTSNRAADTALSTAAP